MGNGACVRDGVFSYIDEIPTRDGDSFHEWDSSKDFYIERDWNRVVNQEVIFNFNNNLKDAANKCTEQHCHKKSALTDEKIVWRKFKLIFYCEYEI